jgi:Sortase domain
VTTASAGWNRRVVLWGGAAALLFLLTGCSTPIAPPGAVVEQPVRAAQLPSAPPLESHAPTAPERVPEVPVRSAALDDLDLERPVPPVRLRIGSLDLDLPVKPVGVRKDGSMQVPENPSVVGWYKFGPGVGSDSGATVLAAHVDSLRYGLGPFAQLKNLQPGAKVKISDADGDTITYRVEKITRTGKAELVDAGVFKRSGKPRLHLITCGGSFDQQSRTYSDNVIVTAIPVG